jgi:type VII secretion-associated serine protease mycosin
MLSYTPGWVLVKLRPGVMVQGLEVSRVIPRIGVLYVRVPEGQERQAAASLGREPEVEFAEPDYRVVALNTPDDPYYSLQWNLQVIGAEDAWDLATGGDSVTIAILDTGVDLTHPDLVSQLVPGVNILDPSAAPQDDHGHGSHVAGIAAASSNNSTGVAGVSWGARLMPVKVLDDQGSGTVGGVAQGIIWAVDHGARVVNISGGTEEPSQTLQEAVDYAYQAGVLVVAAAGNTGGLGGSNPVIYPAALPHVLAVAATDANDHRADFSQRGAYVDVAAPGVAVLSTALRGSGSTLFDLDYDYKTGTSMAAPHVAGLAALIWSANPSLNNDQLEQLVERTAVDLGDTGRDDLYGFGRIDAYQALRAATGRFLAVTPQQLTFLSDMANREAVTKTVSLSNQGGVAFSWTAAISPTVTWLTLSPTAGNALAPGASQSILVTAWPQGVDAAGSFTATLVFTGEGDVQGSPMALPVDLLVVNQLERRFFPWMVTTAGGTH